MATFYVNCICKPFKNDQSTVEICKVKMHYMTTCRKHAHSNLIAISNVYILGVLIIIIRVYMFCVSIPRTVIALTSSL